MRIWQPQFERRKCHGPSHMQNVADKWHYRKQPLWKRLASNLFAPKYLRMESLGFPCCCDDDVCNCHCVCNVFTDPEDTGEGCAPCCVWVRIQYTGTASDGLHALMQSEFNDCSWANCDESVRMGVISAGGESWININASDNMFQKIYPGNNSLKCSDVGDGIFNFEHIYPDPSPSPTPLCHLTIAEGNDNQACDCLDECPCDYCSGGYAPCCVEVTITGITGPETWCPGVGKTFRAIARYDSVTSQVCKWRGCGDEYGCTCTFDNGGDACVVKLYKEPGSIYYYLKVIVSYGDGHGVGVWKKIVSSENPPGTPNPPNCDALDSWGGNLHPDTTAYPNSECDISGSVCNVRIAECPYPGPCDVHFVDAVAPDSLLFEISGVNVMPANLRRPEWDDFSCGLCSMLNGSHVLTRSYEYNLFHHNTWCMWINKIEGGYCKQMSGQDAYGALLVVSGRPFWTGNCWHSRIWNMSIYSLHPDGSLEIRVIDGWAWTAFPFEGFIDNPPSGPGTVLFDDGWDVIFDQQSQAWFGSCLGTPAVINQFNQTSEIQAKLTVL